MLHPVGAHSPAVYWKRRAAGILVLIVLSVIPVLALTSRGESQAEQPVVAAPTTAATSTPALELIPAQPLATTTPAPSTAEPAESAPAETSAPTTTPTATPTPAPTQAPPPADPVPCTDEMMALTVAPEAEYTVSDKPTLVLTVQNIGTGPCTRDLGEGVPEFLIFDGETRLWGSNDCIPGEGSEVRTLAPGDSAALSVLWSGLTAEPTCTADRVRLAPGSYTLRARLGTAQSPDGVLTLR